MLLHTDTFTHRCFYIQTLCAQTLLHTEALTHRLDTQIRLHTDAFTEKGMRRTEENRNFTLTIEPHFVRKGCAGRKKIAICLSFLSIEPHFVRKGCCGREKITILPQFFIEPPHFVRKGCISWRLVGTGPRLQREEGERRGQEGKRATAALGNAETIDVPSPKTPSPSPERPQPQHLGSRPVQMMRNGTWNWVAWIQYALTTTLDSLVPGVLWTDSTPGVSRDRYPEYLTGSGSARNSCIRLFELDGLSPAVSGPVR